MFPTDGRKVLGSIDVGVRLRHDCPNITAASSWAADRSEWITAGDLLGASESAYHLNLRFSEYIGALRRTAPHVRRTPRLHHQQAFVVVRDMTGIWRTAPASIRVVAAAIAEVLLGQPHDALVTVSQLDDFDLPLQDGTEARALAHLAIGDTERALHYIQRLAVRASTGAYPRELDDALLMFAALAHHHGNHDTAREFVLATGGGRQPGTVAYARHLARQLDIPDEQMKQLSLTAGVTRSLNALRAELTRRGWD